MTKSLSFPFTVQVVYILLHFPSSCIHPRLVLRQENLIKDDPSSHKMTTRVLPSRTHGWDCLAKRACAVTKLRKEVKVTFLWALEPALRCNAFSSMITPLVALSPYKTSCFCWPSSTTGYDVMILIWCKSRMLANIYCKKKQTKKKLVKIVN